ncbi:MAG: ATP-binding cassette domain-containing protein, partial [Nocardioidaceae bacterium]
MSAHAAPRLAVEDLSVTFTTDEGTVLAVHDVSFTLGPSEVLALVGESGCGKSMTALSIMRLLPPAATMTGSVRLDGRELTTLSSAAMREVRGRDVSMIFQEPMTSLN